MKLTFNHDGYRHLLRFAQAQGVDFVPYERAGGYPYGKFCLLRHDIDTDLKAALQMAQVEAELGVCATYFFMLRSPVYNLFGRQNQLYAEQIARLGHWVGLHFDYGFVEAAGGGDINPIVEREARVLNAMLGVEVETVSFHQPSRAVLENRFKLARFVNTYDRDDMAGIFYLSDSNMDFKHDVYEVFERENAVQLLVHPMWWSGSGEDGCGALWLKSLADNFARSLDQIKETERAFGPASRRLVVRETGR